MLTYKSQQITSTATVIRARDLNGYTVSTLNGASFSQVVFDFAVSFDLLAQGLIAAVTIGLVGGLFPAIRAVRIPVSAALREL